MCFFNHSYCQSCGMPLSKDKYKGGSEANGSRSKLYCSRCYHNGTFREPHLTASEMVEKVKAKLALWYIPGFIAHRMTKNIPGLKRWNNK